MKEATKTYLKNQLATNPAWAIKALVKLYTYQTACEQAGDLVIDHDDTSAYLQDKSFALLLHGTQPKGSNAAKALSLLRKQGIGGYGKQKKTRELAVVVA